MISTEDYLDIRARVANLGCALGSGITFLPSNFDSAASANDFTIGGEVTTIRKVLGQAGVVSAVLTRDGARSPGFVHNKSHDWAVPIIFVGAEILKTSPDIIGVVIDLIRDYALSILRGVSTDRNIKAEIVVERDRGTYQKIIYEGGVEGLTEITKMVAKIHGQDVSGNR